MPRVMIQSTFCRHQDCTTNVHRGATSTAMTFNQVSFMKVLHALALISLPACSGTTEGGSGGSSGIGGANVAGGAAAGGHSGISTGGRRPTGGSTNAAQGGTTGVGTGGSIPCGVCPAVGPCIEIACVTGGAGNGGSTAGQTCAVTADCIAGLTCCYPCGTPGCTNRCTQLTPQQNGVCPAYP
jgi:hypothetical protein